MRRSFTRYYLRLRRSKWFRLTLPVLGCVLIAVNLLYTFLLIDRRVNPDTGHIVRALNDFDRKTRQAAFEWLETPESDTAFISRLWREQDVENWSHKGISLLLFRDSTLVYWSSYQYQLTDESHWLATTNTLETIGKHQIIKRVYEREGKSAVAVFNLWNQESDLYNTHVFPQQRINLLSSDDTLRAELVDASPVRIAGNHFFVEAKHMRTIPWFAEVCGWIGIVMLCLYVKNLIRDRTRPGNVFLCSLILFLTLGIMRLVIYYASIPNPNGMLFNKLYGQHGHFLESLADVLLTYLFLLIFISYLYQVRQKLSVQVRKLSSVFGVVLAVSFQLLIAITTVLFHYTLILAIHTPRINVQIYDLFDLSFYTVVFYVLAAVFVAIRILMNRLEKLTAGRKILSLRVTCTGLFIFLLLVPLREQINQSGFFLVLFCMLFTALDVLRVRMKNYASFIVSLITLAGYMTFFVTLETSNAQNNSQKVYARILATSAHDRSLTRGMQTEQEVWNMDARYRKFTFARISESGIQFKNSNHQNYQELNHWIAQGRDTLVSLHGETHYIYNYTGLGGRKETLVISRRETNFLDTASLYAYIFIIFYILSGFLLLVTGYDFNIRHISTRMTLRIRAVVIGVVIFALISVTAVIVKHTMDSFRDTQREQLNNTIQRLSNSLNQYLVNNPTTEASIAGWLESESDGNGFITSFYCVHGKLVVSSAGENDPLPVTRVSHEAYRDLITPGHLFFISDIATDPYPAAFVAVHKDGQAIGYLNVRHSHRISSTNSMRNELLADILNLFLIILLVAIVFSEFLYHLLTKPFDQLHDAMRNISKMQKIDAVGSSKKISDEIGLLVEQYNLMIDHVAQTYRLLAESEREVAWREMARQVAHEIKNPLTPMRLKIQILQRKMESEPCEELKPQVENTLDLLLEQIELLNRIASEFSNFAKMGAGDPARIDLMPLLGHVVKLYSGYKDLKLQIHYTSLEKPTHIWVEADKNHLTRVFVNILQNAVQALSGKADGRIDLFVATGPKSVWISIQDNGPGIPREIRKRIFQPNFTTKSSGSGLGLALSKKIIEILNGKIDFETGTGKGTTFTVELPLSEEPQEIS